jgi:WD40 repeat protein
VNSAISDISYFSLDSIYLLALISANNIHFLDLPKKANSSFIFRETLSLEIIEKKDKLIENPLEGIFKPTTLEKEFLNCCDFGYRIRSNSSRITYSESDTDLILACAGRIGLIYIITIDEGFAVDYLYGHINEVYSVKFATPNQLFNFQNILLSGSKDGSMILWNIKNEVKVAIFAPKQNPHSDVLNAVWSPGCDYIASVGLESTVKVWMVNEKLKKKIEESHLLNLKNVKSFKSIEMNAEIYRNNEAHKNFEWQIDQIEFYGF